MAIKNLQQGVTLIELIIVVAIFGIVSSILLFNFSDFSTNVSLRNLTQEMALAMRKAQTYATSVRGANASALSSYPAYGISFSIENQTGAYVPNSKNFVIFADIPNTGDIVGNKLYDNNGTCGIPQSGDECVESLGIATADKIVGLTYIDGNGDVQYACGSLSATCMVNVLFHRPSPDADICVVQGSTCEQISNLNVVLRSAKGLEKTVSVWNTGQISTR